MSACTCPPMRRGICPACIKVGLILKGKPSAAASSAADSATGEQS